MNYNLFQKMEITENKIISSVYKIRTIHLKEMIMPYINNMAKWWKSEKDKYIEYFINTHPRFTNYGTKSTSYCCSHTLYLNKTFSTLCNTQYSISMHFNVIGLTDDCVLYLTADQYGMCKRIGEYNCKTLKQSLIDEKDYQCVICFEPIDRKQICVPCGHTQYCDHCIGIINECAICRTKINKIIKIY
jgi:hypothetical protein